jgi:uncharacterized surface protein with fasciclin (FAS1) repeats
MKNNFNVRSLIVLAIVFAFSIALIGACKRESYTQTTNDDVNITGYLDKFPDKFSLMKQIVEQSGTAGFLGAYGKYTLFTPTNDAITAWLKAKGKNSVSDLTVEEAKDVVKIHLLADTVATNKFTDGKLAQITLYGQYLQTGIKNEAGESSYIVNKLAKITQSNVRLGNGIIHVIDHVLIPATLSSAAMIEASGRYKYFTQALKETGFYDSLNVAQSAVTDSNRRFQTVVLESDSALAAAGYANYAAFKARYSKTGNPKSHADSLWLYMAYHVSLGPSYTPDIIVSPAIYTLAPREIITTKFAGQKILLNEDEYNGVLEPGVEINRTYSDITTANGVLHEVKKPFTIKVRLQIPVYFDVCDQPELKSNPKWRGTAAAQIPLIANGASVLSGLIFNNPAKTTTPENYDYVITPGSTRKYNANDMFNLSMGTNTARAQWIELKTPMLVKGKYKVWICYASNSSACAFQVGVDVGRAGEQILPNIVDFRQSLGSSGVTSANAGLASADPLMLTNGFKRYMATTAESVVVNGTTVKGALQINTTGWDLNVGRLAGTVDIGTTDRHWIRLSVISTGLGSNSFTWLDMIHFIPVDADQNYPRFSTQGYQFLKP